ncbi:MAG: hypothetical protein IJW78_05605 [Clostridia bacterium]|nr:hypothetical protein [Clostridia bacterium]MBQ7289181.1 hypothetical protein [Clostridia bacterium]
MTLFNLHRITSGILFLCIFVSLSGCALSEIDWGDTPQDTSGTIAYQSKITLRYQYAMLSEKEKEIYGRIFHAVSDGNRFADVEEYQVSSAVCKKILNAVLCDSPDIFWVSRDFLILHESNFDFVQKIYFRYFDGSVVDDYDVQSDGSIVYRCQAEESRIRTRIEQCMAKVDSCLSAWDNMTPSEVEIAIHDWVAATVQYDEEVASAMETDSTAEQTEYFDRFTAYGALMDGYAVCEGYAKLFQYLCLLKDINCTQVSGYAENQGHMWNAVCLSDGWYFVDVTFDDMDSDELDCIYTYLNVDLTTLSNTHTLSEDELLAVPECSSDRQTYNKRNLINIVDGQISSSYESMIEQEISKGKDCILIYFPNGDYSYDLFVTAMYDMENSLSDCILRYGSSVEKIMALEPHYALIFLKSNGV